VEQQYIDEIKSDQRDEAAAFNEDFRYLPQQESSIEEEPQQDS
jgi:hypothetical protein